MHTFKTITRSLAALGLGTGLAVGAALPAAATPIYHVTIDTRTLSGRDGYLDFLITTLADVSPVHATLRGLPATPGAGDIVAGDVAVAGESVTIGNAQGYDEYAQWLHLGDSLSFDIAFDLAPVVDPALNADTTLQVSLLDSGFGYLGGQGDALDVELHAGQDPLFTAAGGIQVAAVPEAPGLWLSATGLGLLGLVKRRAPRMPTRPRARA
jgi:hypothetical protein